ncbi:3665_t:CDS:10, partial [Entrophospora sp. SA101]
MEGIQNLLKNNIDDINLQNLIYMMMTPNTLDGVTFYQKGEAEKALFRALETINSKNDIHAATAKRVLNNFNNFISSSNVEQFWSSIREQNGCQIRTNMLEEKINLLTTKRKEMHDFEEKKVTKQMQKEQDVDKLTFDDKLEIDTNDEVDFHDNKVFSMNPNILTDSDANDHKVFQDYEECCEEEIPIEKTLTNPITSWILSSGRDVGVILSKYCEKIPHTSKGPFLFIIQITQIYIIVKINEVLAKNPHDLITGIESCVIKGNIKVNAIRRLIQTYAFNFQRLQFPMSEAAFGSNFTNTFTKRILTFDQTYHYEKGEIQGLASSVISNLKTKPTDRSLIGQKVDFRISKDQFELLIGLRSGGLLSATKGKKWMDKVDLAVLLQDVLINEGIESNGVEPSKFQKLFVLGVHSYNWRSKSVWYLGLLQKVKLPTSIDYLPAIEKLIISLLRVEVGNLVGLNCIFMVLLIFDHFFDRKLYIVIEEVIESVGNVCCIAHAINLIAYDIVKENFGDCLSQQVNNLATFFKSSHQAVQLAAVLKKLPKSFNKMLCNHCFKVTDERFEGFYDD